ncbi:alkaline shock response membrane anchor protein AmaP [Rhodococcus triatomae]|uniref:Alkaline shock response membrane anchor protein AmaP n=1 Tax=Rhodococcus triatomae TaxID=300028 RepID=A0A1G8NL55_9NOCA|nr:hypothetical protein [Rhodococcus triatomae]QNG20033.1 alkaline shock response membrane anchor protein AmaP [Rhodococcus triatomae]QNG24051.1 alkaline shock response membrane anchor protein AmaP [Rhodococcus triatomae]SDI81021.1 hypothetical protein SAMN05444695_111103 [Rhodococcus triatomae]
MTRIATAVDRVVAFLVGLALLAAGAAAIVWNTDLVSGAPEHLTTPWFDSVRAAGWYPWLLGGAGLALTLLALRWLFAHGPASKVRRLVVPTDGAGGVVSVDVGEIASAAAVAAESVPEVLSADGRAVVDRGVPTVELDVTVSLAGGIDTALASTEQVREQLSAMVGPLVATRTRVRVERGARVR